MRNFSSTLEVFNITCIKYDTFRKKSNFPYEKFLFISRSNKKKSFKYNKNLKVGKFEMYVVQNNPNA